MQMFNHSDSKTSPLLRRTADSPFEQPNADGLNLALTETRNGTVLSTLKNGVVMSKYSEHPAFLPQSYLIDDKYKFARDNDLPTRLHGEDDEWDGGGIIGGTSGSDTVHSDNQNQESGKYF